MDLSMSSSMEEESRLLCHAPHAQSLEQQHAASKCGGYLDHEPAASQTYHSSFAEALLFAQSRAREAEEVLYSYDVRVEEVVMRALTLLDASRHKEMLCQQRLEYLKSAVLEEERASLLQQESLESPANLNDDLIDDALNRTVLRAVASSNLDAEAVEAEAGDLDTAAEGGVEEASCGVGSGLLQGAYHALRAVALNAASSNLDSESALKPVHGSEASLDLSVALAQAYADLGDAREKTQRHKVLLEELEMLVEPVLKYRHSGVYDAQRYHYSAHEDAARGASAGIHGAMADDAGPSVEGSSVVLVSTADALQDDEALDPARAGCFALVAAKVKSQEEARRCRSVLLRLQQALDSFEELGEHMSEQAAKTYTSNSNSHGCGADPGGQLVESKVSSLLLLVKSQQEEIKQLRQHLCTGAGRTREAAASLGCPQPFPPGHVSGRQSEAGDSRGAALFLKQRRLHADEERQTLGSLQTESSCGYMQCEDTWMDSLQGNSQDGCAGQSQGHPHRQRQRMPLTSAASARNLIEFSAYQAHMLVDVCEEVLLRGVAVALEMLDQALQYLCVGGSAPALSDHPLCLPGPPAPSPYAGYTHPAWCTSEQKPAVVEWWFLTGDNLYDVYC